jgi:hypothetical protein
MRMTWLCLTALILTSTASAQQAPPPALFFSDLTNGPATGNSDSTFSSNGGVYVTLYGNFFGTSPTVTLNGASCLVIVSPPATWMWYQKMTVQLKSTCTSGNFAVTTPSGTSNGLPFAVNTGKIYYVSTSGSDSSGNGSFSAPWATLPYAVQTTGTTAGNVIYAENGVSQTTADSQGWNASITLRSAWCNGTPAQPNYLVAYPGAAVVVGNTSATLGLDAIRATDSSASPGACTGNWTFAGLHLQGGNSAVSFNGPNSYPTGGASGWRLVGSDVTCPNAGGATGCIHTANIDNTGSSGIANHILGNNFHDIGNTAPQPNTDQQHGVYMGDQSRHWELGWNTVSNVVACRGIQVYSNTAEEFDFTIHDNTVHDTTCDGILVWTSNPSAGSVSVYNNVVYNVGKGPATREGGGAFNCIYANHLNNSTPGSGIENYYNNTCFASGTINNTGSGCYEAGLSVGSGSDPVVSNFLDNIVFDTGSNPACPNGIPVWRSGAPLTPVTMTGTSNIGWSVNPSQSIPANVSNMTFNTSINSDPLFVNASVSGCPTNCATDLHLSAVNSPAIGAGAIAGPVPTYDHDGVLRGATPAIGAYEFAAGAITRPNPPTNLTVTVQ